MNEKKEKSGHWKPDPEWPDDEGERYYWCFNSAEFTKETEMAEGLQAGGKKDLDADGAEALLGDGGRS